MGLLDRVATLVRANLNDLIDQAEDPEKMLKQVILDMQNQLIQVKTQVAVAMADEHLLRRKLVDSRASEAEYLTKAAAAIDKARDDLARVSVERALTHRQMTAGLTEQLADQTAQVENLKSALMRLEAKLTEARAKSELLITRHRRARAVSRAMEASAVATSDGPIATFDRMRDKVDRAEAISAAHAELQRESLDDELSLLGREDEVNRILEQMRGRKRLA
jgi:phage shock protein A